MKFMSKLFPWSQQTALHNFGPLRTAKCTFNKCASRKT